MPCERDPGQGAARLQAWPGLPAARPWPGAGSPSVRGRSDPPQSFVGGGRSTGAARGLGLAKLLAFVARGWHGLPSSSHVPSSRPHPGLFVLWGRSCRPPGGRGVLPPQPPRVTGSELSTPPGSDAPFVVSPRVPVGHLLLLCQASYFPAFINPVPGLGLRPGAAEAGHRCAIAPCPGDPGRPRFMV